MANARNLAARFPDYDKMGMGAARGGLQRFGAPSDVENGEHVEPEITKS